MVIAKNAEKVIAKCLSSIIEQLYQPTEIIVVDSRSTDKTRDIASRFPVRLILAPPKDTYGTSRNLGVKTAKGDIIAFLDADDYADKRWLENILKAFNHTNVGIVNPKRVYVYPSGWFANFIWNKMRKNGRSKDKLIAEKPWMTFGTTGSAFRKELIEKAGYFDEDMFFGTEDKDLAIRIFNMGHKIAFEPNAVIYFRPSSSVKEWLKEIFYRHGLGHGTIRRRYGEYKPPTRTPIATAIILFCFLILVFYNLWQLMPFLFIVPILGIAIRTYKLFRQTKELLHSFAYVMLEISARNLEFLGFILGYLISAKTLRKIAKR